MEPMCKYRRTQDMVTWNGDKDGGKLRRSLDDFPVEILQHIVSFLPAKDAVATSILSKRWQYLWASVPNFVFLEEFSEPEAEGNDRKHKLLINFVDREFSARDMISRVKDYFHNNSITGRGGSDQMLRIQGWIAAAIRLNPQKLSICLEVDLKQECELPHCLLTCDSLTDMEICMPNRLKLPPSVFLMMNLKVLTLKDVVFSDYNSPRQLFRSPNLEQLCIDHCHWLNTRSTGICAPKLASLKIYEADNSDYPNFIIIGISLESFIYSGRLLNCYRFVNASTNLKASIHISCLPVLPKRFRQVCCRVFGLLLKLRDVRELTLSHNVLEVIPYEVDIFQQLRIHRNLTSLTLNWGLKKFNWKSFLAIVQIFPCLEALEFSEVFADSELAEVDRILNPVPTCFMSHLKSIKIVDFYGTENELDVVKVLLQSAAILERMVIERLNGLKINEVRGALLELPRGSKSCKVDLDVASS